MTWAYLWSRMRAVPAGVYIALSGALALLFMFLRGRRLEGELAHAQLLTAAANAAVVSAASEGEAQIHLDAAAEHASNAAQLQLHVAAVSKLGTAEQARLAALAPSEVTAAFLKLAQSKK